MPIDPYAALNAMVRAEVARSQEPVMDQPGERRPGDNGDASPEGPSAGDASATGNRD
ncbi:hypothetical protein [Streptomyces sp. H27-C3]|uniref:hypothetical protein n=1 Tax=Streptomyces sp. H27-C3 TaxID=3046305 RepID=UPI0024BA30D0|nr:hypothetical protein [Streptomyces sp. H27-C3]MDJ0461929.1 hypothetical protein [Streptomyces sp. H27-C3]